MTPLGELIGESPGIVALREQVGRLLSRQSEHGRLPPILIQGETGTGKGLLARALHRTGTRAGGPFVEVNCPAIPEGLLEAELFGYERGAFTDAKHPKAGLFQTANRGTLFLDEVGLLPEGLQAKLLKALEDKAVRRLGSTRSEPVDVWILTATNEDLVAAVRARRFREDLYHRLAVVTLRLPALRERGQDVLHLAGHFLARACAEYRLRPKTLSPAACAALLGHSWPGNVRELANVMERVALVWDAPVVTEDMLGLPDAPPAQAATVETGEPPRTGSAAPLEDALGHVERAHVLEALRESGWNVTRSAERLGISRDTLRYRIAKHGLQRERPGAPAGTRPSRAEPALRRGPATPASAPAPAPPAARPAPGVEAPRPLAVRWERRRLAFLRVALALPADSDPRLYPSRALEVLVDKVRSFGGHVEELSPAGLVGVFGLEPVEDAPVRAVHAATAIQKAAERAWRAEAERVAVRSAVCVRPVLLGAGAGSPQIDLDGKREAWTTLEHLVAAAAPDSLVVNQATAPFLERHFDLTPVASATALPERVFRVTLVEQPGGGLARRRPAFVGRTRELELLRSRLEDAIRGHGQVVGLLGEAGIGKSRLLHEFRQRVLGEPDLRLTYLVGRCQSYATAMPYFPILEILRQNFRLAEGDGPGTIGEKVRACLAELAMDPDQSAPYILRLFGVSDGAEALAALTPGAIKARTFEALRQLTLKGARRRPILFVIEDLHWIDATSEECLTALMDSAAGAPAMVIATYRPGYRPPWMDRSYVTQVALQPLSRADSLRVVGSVLVRDDTARLAEAIATKAEGNPFFLEELSRSAEEAKDPQPVGTVPDTIQEVLLARIARLPEAPRQLLQTAAVVGHELPLPLLRAVWEGPGDLDAALGELARLEFLYAESGGLDRVYAFTHTLTREVAYESVSPPRRRGLHAVIARTLEAVPAERLGEALDRLAFHYARTDDAGKAVFYLSRAAEKAARSHAHAEAVRMWEAALGHVDRLPAAERDRCRLELAIAQAYSLIPLGRFREIVELLCGHEAALARLGDPRLTGQYHFLVSRSYLFLGDDERASHHATAGLAEAAGSGDDATSGKIHYVLAQRGAMSGRPREGLEHGRQAVACLERAGEPWWVGPAWWAVGLNHGLLGQFGLALEAEGRAAASGEAVGDPELRSSAAWATGIIHATLGEWEAGVAACRRAVELAPDPLDTALALGWLGYAHVERGDAAEALPCLEQAIELLGQFHFPQPQGWFTAFLAEAQRLAGRLELARTLAGRATGQARASHSAHGVGWAERALGRIALARGELAEAETHLGEALATFRAMDARYEVARTHLDLAALARTRDDREGARHHAGEAERLFTEIGAPRCVERVGRLAAELGLAR